MTGRGGASGRLGGVLPGPFGLDGTETAAGGFDWTGLVPVVGWLVPEGPELLTPVGPGWARAGSFRRKPPPDSLQGRRKEQQPDSAAMEKNFRSLPVWVQAVPAGCCSALRDAPVCQVRLEHQRQAYGCEAHSASEKLCCCYLSECFQKRLGGQKYPQAVLRPEPDGKGCRGFGVFRRFCRILP